ncbi:YhcN/YlaJ family sporulation lipoprotein [Bacillus sp. DJP31]|uniref:YhcN/YlaJ family sporulation lipoprotein n=1 Tax=Bacillus sp. DJP31 TaxID=3409789 RepID=UPI003BB4B158
MCKRLLIFLCLGISLVLQGCGNVQTVEDQNGVQLMKYNEKKDGFYERDLGDEEFLTNQSATNYIDVTESRPNIGTDQDKIREVVDTFDDVTPGSVFINGNDAYVTVHTTNEAYTENERDHLRHKLLKSITGAVPRYHINVKVH